MIYLFSSNNHTCVWKFIFPGYNFFPGYGYFPGYGRPGIKTCLNSCKNPGYWNFPGYGNYPRYGNYPGYVS